MGVNMDLDTDKTMGFSSSLPAIFRHGLPLPPPANSTSLFEHLMREKLQMIESKVEAVTQLPTPVSPESSNDAGRFLTDVGDCFIRNATAMDILVQDLLGSHELRQAAHEIHECTRSQTHLSDFKLLAEVDEDLSRLYKIRDLTANFLREVQETWRPSMRTDENSVRLPPIQTHDEVRKIGDEVRRIGMIQPKAKSRGNNARQKQHSNKPKPEQHNSPEEDDSGSDVSDGDDELFAKLDMEALKSRGKGNHVCPKGPQCTKGGVDKDGSMIVFDRNSSFVQHCNKHRKPYRCTLEGCPNQPKKRKFARRDGLERHQRSVPHLTTPLQTSSSLQEEQTTS
jgi:hypothetical protein